MGEFASTLTLASKGVFYQDAIPEGVVSVNPITTSEEKLIGSSLNVEDLLDRLIGRLVDLPKNGESKFAPADLLVADRFHLLLHLRIISYQSEYSFPFRCEDCNQKVQSMIDLSKLSIDFADPGLQEPFEVLLPMCGSTVSFNLLRGSDERAISKYERRMHSRGRARDGDPAYTYRIARRVVEVDGNPVDIGEAQNFVSKLVGGDSVTLRDAFDGVPVGVDPEIEPICSVCQYPNGPFFLPFDREFFRPKRRDA